MFHVLTHEDESSWHEDEVTWNDAPRSYNHIAQLDSVRSGDWNKVDITNALVGPVGNFVTIIINSTTKNRVVYGSKESEHAPQLIIAHMRHNIQAHTGPVDCQKPAAGTSSKLHPVDSANIKEAESDENFAHVSNLNAKYEVGARVDFLLKFRFDCKYTDSIVKQAVLKLYCKNGTPRGGKIIGVLGSWTEDAVTWNNAPFSPTSYYDEIGRVRKGRWVEIDVTSAIDSIDGGEATFRIEGMHANAAVYSSKEEDTYSPILEVLF